jgi:hypothetical protein
VGADHAGLHDSGAMRRELDRRFSERLFAWAPYLYRELGEAVQAEERSSIEAGELQATDFVYVGERTRGGSAAPIRKASSKVWVSGENRMDGTARQRGPART